MRILKISGFIGLLISIILFALSLYTLLFYSSYITSKSRILNYKNQGIVLSDRDNIPYYLINNANSDEYTPLKDISPNVVNAVIVAEDKSFYKHNGISPKSILRSIYLNLRSGKMSYGGSTITQQLVKNTLLSPKKSIVRKIQESVLAIEIDSKFSKDEIMEMYLNSTYFGEGSIGIGKASRLYFGKEAKYLNVGEAAYLAGMLKLPNLASPYSGDKQLGSNLQKQVVEKMFSNKLISKVERDHAVLRPVKFRQKLKADDDVAQHFSLLVIDKLKEIYGSDVLYEGLRVKTSLNISLQRYVENVLRESISLNRINGVGNGAVVVMDPTTGEILALAGSADWYDEKSGKINMAVSPRQPGSTFKPIVYSMALDQGIITTSTILNDAPVTFILDRNCKSSPECVYKPKNYDGRFRGKVTIRKALANSLNIPAIEVMERVGSARVVGRSQEYGINTMKEASYYGKGLSLVLGSAEVSPLEMASAYSTFANEGRRPEPIYILEIKDKFGKILYTAKPRFHRVISDQTAFIINSILSDPAARADAFGYLLSTPFTAAVKTGTTDGYKDAWTIGYTPMRVVAVWVGNNDSKPIRNLPGSLAAAPIWKQIMQYEVDQGWHANFVKPKGIVLASFCNSNSSGSARMEYFVEGLEPEKTCNQFSNDTNEVAGSMLLSSP